MKLFAVLVLIPFLAFGADIQSPEVFTDSGAGATVNAARLGNHVNGATILPTFISDKSADSPLSTDYVLYFKTSSAALKKATVANLLAGGINSVGLSAPSIFSVSGSPLTTGGTITLTLANQNANLVFAGPASGSAAAPTFRALTVADITPASNAVAALDIDWSASNAFGPKTITGDTTFTFSNVRDGQTIVVCVAQDGAGGHSVTWPTVSWSGGSAPAATLTASKKDIWTFIRIGSVTYGSVVQNF